MTDTEDFSVVVRAVKRGDMSIVERAADMIAFVTQQDEAEVLKECKAQAAAIIAYLRQRKDLSVAEHNAALKVRVRVEHRLGEILAETVKHGGHNAKQGNSMLPCLPGGIGRMQSSRAQRVAAVPWEVIESRIESATEENAKTSQAKILREYWQEQIRSRPLGNGCIVAGIDELIASGKRFATIYADPPWRYGNQATRAATDNHYTTMATYDIAALRVSELAEESAHLHLWTTNGFLEESFGIIKAWGFTFKSILIWCKPQIGLGNYWRVSHEILLLGVRGDLPFGPDAKSYKSWTVIDRGKHSSKPDQIRTMIEKASPPQYLELFGRRSVQGWTVMGNEIEKDLISHSIEEAETE